MRKLMILGFALVLCLGVAGMAAAADIENWATVTGNTLNSASLGLITSSTTVATYVGNPVISIAKAQLLLDGTRAASGRTYVTPGDYIRYTIYISNTSPAAGPNDLQVEDLIPTNTEYDTGGGGAAIGGTDAADFTLNYTNNAGGAWTDGDLTDGDLGNSQNGIGMYIGTPGDFAAISADADATLTFEVLVLTQ